MAGYQSLSSEAMMSIRRYRSLFSCSNGIDYAVSENVEAESRKDDNLQEYLNEIDAS